MLTILRHTHLNSHRRQRPDLARETYPRALSPEQTLTDQVLSDSVEIALASLDPRFRTVLLLIDVDQLTYTETAGLLDIPVGTVMSRLSRARDRVRTHLRSNPEFRRSR